MQVTDCGWKSMFLRLCLFRQRFGHAEVPMEKEDGDVEGVNRKELRSWQHIQRIAYARGKMSKVRRDALEAVGFKWHHSGVVCFSSLVNGHARTLCLQPPECVSFANDPSGEEVVCL